LYSEGFKAGGFQHDARNLQSFFEGIVDSYAMPSYGVHASDDSDSSCDKL